MPAPEPSRKSCLPRRGGALGRVAGRLSILFTGTFAGSGLAFATQILLARTLPLESFGSLAALLAAVNFLTPVASAGVNWFLLRAYGTEGAAARRWLRPSAGLVALATAASALALLVYAGAGGTLSPAERSLALAACIPILLGQVAVELASARLQLEERFTSLTVLQTATQAGRFLILAAAALAASGVTLGGVVLGYALVGALTAGAGGVLLAGLFTGRVRLAGHAPAETGTPTVVAGTPSIGHAAAEAGPYALVTMFYVLYFQGIVVVLEWLAGGAAAAAFNVAFLVVSAAALIPGVVYTRFLVAKLNRWAEHDRDRFRDVFQLGVAAMLLVGLVVMLGIALLAGPAVRLVFGPGYAAAAAVLLVLAPGIPIRFVQMAYSSLYVSRADTVRKARYLGLGALASMLACIALVPIFGALGAAAANVLAEAVLLGLHMRGAVGILGRDAARDALRPWVALRRLRHAG